MTSIDYTFFVVFLSLSPSHLLFSINHPRLHSMETVPFNEIQGIASKNVPAHSNEHDDYISFDGCYVHGIYTGYKWQCVEYARRWLLLRKGCIFQSFPAAADMWQDLKYVERVTDGRKFSVRIHPNGSSSKPHRDCFLLYPRGENIPFGHIAVICDVHEDFIRVAEQNYRFHYWPDNHSRQIRMIKRDNGYWIEDYYPVYGWMEIEQNDQLKPLDLTRDFILDRYRSLKSIGQFQSCTNDSKEIYCKVDEDFLLNLSSVSNELYQLIRETTENIIGNDQLLRGFRIPEIFWSKIRRSWIEENQLDLINYLQLKFDGKTFQLCPYRSDQILHTLECACKQSEKVENMKLAHDFTSTFQIHRLLVRNWQRLNIQGIVHLLIENEEEMNIAVYMKKVMNEAGINAQLCRLSKDLIWKDGNIVDKNEQIVEIIWKIWDWERIFQTRDHHPYLYDILLHPRIRLLEPIWKSIINHSILFPVLCAMYPNHSNILPQSMNDYSDKTIISWMINGFFSGFTVHNDRNLSSIYCCVV